MIARLVAWLLIGSLLLGLVLVALGHAVVVLLCGLGAGGYALWRRRAGG